jgi:5S rRNA maturation endonuclease (ribonuclease M5)
LSTRLKEKEEKIQQLLQHLTEEASRGIQIVVEGKKDIEALKALEVEGSMVSAKTGGKSLFDTVSEVEKTKAQEVILLLDYDRRGKEWTQRLKHQFEKAGITPNLTFWTRLFAIVGREVKDIEGLATYMETLKSMIHNS